MYLHHAFQRGDRRGYPGRANLHGQISEGLSAACPTPIAAEAYDAITLALLAIEKAGRRIAPRSATRWPVSFDSVRGPFKFDEKGDPLLVTHVVKIVDGKETNARNMAVQN